VIVVFTFVGGVISLLGTSYRHSVIAALLLIALVQAVALFWRRTQPLAVLLAVVVTMFVGFAIAPDREVSAPALAFAVYATSAYGHGRARLAVVVAGIAMVIGAVALLLLNDFETSRKLLPAGAITLVVWVIGDYMRSRRHFFADLVARHQHEREQAADEERLRIARELHDVVAHNVSLMAIQAGAARVAGNLDGEGQRALQSIEVSARDTLAELNRLLGVLRKEPGQPELSPQPGLDQIDSLLKAARDAGLEVELTTTGTQRPLPPALDLTAYRIVQEATTNALKHAHASRLEVRVAYLPDALQLTIRDNGEGGSEDSVRASTGHGLIGMRERVALFGGELEAGTSDVGGFTVRSRLPLL